MGGFGWRLRRDFPLGSARLLPPYQARLPPTPAYSSPSQPFTDTLTHPPKPCQPAPHKALSCPTVIPAKAGIHTPNIHIAASPATNAASPAAIPASPAAIPASPPPTPYPGRHSRSPPSFPRKRESTPRNTPNAASPAAIAYISLPPTPPKSPLPAGDGWVRENPDKRKTHPPPTAAHLPPFPRPHRHSRTSTVIPEPPPSFPRKRESTPGIPASPLNHPGVCCPSVHPSTCSG